jgi:hypothetical protein
MLVRRRMVLSFALALGCLPWGQSSSALGQETANATDTAYSLASYHGDYALDGTYGANIARLIGTYWADGKGNISGSARVNLPGSNGERAVVHLSFEGTYTVDDDGTGTIHVTITLPDGSTTPATLDLVMTKAEAIRGIKIGAEIVTVQRELSSVVGGQFVTHLSTSRPDSKRSPW